MEQGGFGMSFQMPIHRSEHNSEDSNMKAPIFVLADDRVVEVYSKIEFAEGDMEGVDVNNGVYRGVYDRDGNLLKLVVEGPYDVRIMPSDPPVNKAEELKELIRETITFINTRKKLGLSSEWLSNASFEELAVKLIDFKIR